MAQLYELIQHKKVIKIQKMANQFAKMIDKDLIVKCGLFFQSDIYSKTVYFGVARYEKSQEISLLNGMLDMADSGFNYCGLCEPQTFAFFHEIGHIIMAKNYKSKQFEHWRYTLQVNHINETAKNPTEKNLLYNNIPMEKDANTWALDFILDNPQIVLAFDVIMKQLTDDLFNK